MKNNKKLLFFLRRRTAFSGRFVRARPKISDWLSQKVLKSVRPRLRRLNPRNGIFRMRLEVLASVEPAGVRVRAVELMDG